jgi:hypothetical protein
VAELAARRPSPSWRRLDVRAFGGSLRGPTAALTGAERAVEGRLEWSGLDPSTLPLELLMRRGSLDGWLQVAGSVEHPVGELELRWAGGGSDLVAAALCARCSPAARRSW